METKIKLDFEMIDKTLKFLSDLGLEKQDTYHRDVFVKEIINSLESFKKQKTEILEKYALKDRNGDPVSVISEEGELVYEVGEKEKLNSEWNDLLEKKIEINTSKIDISKIKEIVANSKKIYKFDRPKEEEDIWRESKSYLMSLLS